MKKAKNFLKRITQNISKPVWNIAGSFFVVVGVVGIFVPLLPTTVFLLLAAACYNKGSERFHHWLIHNKLLGPYIQNFKQKNGIPMAVKIRTIILLWLTIGLSIYWVNMWHVTVILLLVAVGVTLFLLTRKTLKP